ncbi:hypothetical protein PRIPAC_73437 [Pristionchus pacificus]|uniref:Uncharacterized protein n=1 Tax=Pristionchus pacificus TaxID=54126 RepID=A0A454XJ89_PRIPA|nr:hypothetical protein PRIPAC_73437 [Pristionchus pacificus]|eukprot:PDM60722.1 hypothetical protein PRIPAC_54528 [Pristionchus pacificus]
MADAAAPPAANVDTARAPVGTLTEAEEPVPGALVPNPEVRSADPVALGNQYKGEFTAYAEGLRLRSAQVQELVQQQLASTASQAESFKATLQDVVQDKSDVQTPPSAVLPTFLWTTVLTLGASVGFFVGANILGGLVHLFFGGFFIALGVLVALPLYAYFTIKAKQAVAGSDAELRMFLLAYALGSGVLLGAGFNSTYFYSEPLAFLTPLVVSLVFAYGAPALGAARPTLLGASVGGALGLTLVAGILTGALSTSYLLLSLMYAGIACLTLMTLFKFVKSESDATHLYMLGYVVAYFYVKALTFFVMGSYQPYEYEVPAPTEARK